MIFLLRTSSFLLHRATAPANNPYLFCETIIMVIVEVAAAVALWGYHSAALQLPRSTRVWLSVAVALYALCRLFRAPAMRQNQRFHDFADRRAWCCGLPNSSDVLSNLAFLLALLPCYQVLYERGFPAHEPCERNAHLWAFLGVAGVAVGSAYYHLRPSDGRLAWDRMPMTVAFTSLLSIALSETIGTGVGCASLCPLVLSGVASVAYWARTGDLRPYYASQYLSLGMVAFLHVTFEARYTYRALGYGSVLCVYAAAKVAEASDKEIFTATGRAMSGHTLKHLLAAAAMLCFYAHLLTRAPL